MRRIIVIFIGNILLVPPIITLIQTLSKKGYHVHVITNIEGEKLEIGGNVKISYINCGYRENAGIISKFLRMLYIRRSVFKILDQLYNSKAILWIAGDTTIKNLGKRLFQYKYILHVLELSEDIYYHYKMKFLRIPGHRLGCCAKAVVIPEYNRAHITKAWWELEKLPFILPNKPFEDGEMKRNASIQNTVAAKVIEAIGERKIILYQGIMHPERPLDKFIKAVNELGDKYAFVIMSNGKDLYKNTGLKYYFIPFVKPPMHLEITSHAYIGILSYFPVKTHHSILNAVFCAPNKTFEYARFGIPMISNDVPALKYLFEMKGCGICIEEFTIENIKKAILKVELTYKEMSEKARDYYVGTDYENILEYILKE